MFPFNGFQEFQGLWRNGSSGELAATESKLSYPRKWQLSESVLFMEIISVDYWKENF